MKKEVGKLPFRDEPKKQIRRKGRNTPRSENPDGTPGGVGPPKAKKNEKEREETLGTHCLHQSETALV